jgi:uncharacterized membrane protein YeaQ/YmgE (transglycosylase-associated protein family)
MNISLGQLIVWIVIGALAGTVAARLLTGRKRGFGWLGNLIIGLLGGLIGGIVFQLLNLRLTNLSLTFTLDDLIAAFVGSLILILLIQLIRR